MTRWRILAVLTLIVAAIFAGSAFPAGDFTFDATTNANADRVKVGDTAPFSLTTAHSITSWTSHTASGIGQVHTARATATTARNWRLATSSANRGQTQASSGGVSTAGYVVDFGTAGVVVDGGWHFVGQRFSSAGGVCIGHVDEVSNTDSSVAATDDPAAKVYLGIEQSGAEDNFVLTSDHRGELDGIRIHSRYLADAEHAVFRNRNARPTRVSPAGLVGHWPMRGVPGTNMGTVRDHSASRADGTAGGTTLPTYSVSYLRGVR